MTKRPEGLLTYDELEDRRVYFIRSRNLSVGVWRAKTKGFIGIREKFGDLYLFEEYHWDNGPPFGTVTQTEPTDTVVPAGIPLEEGRSDGKYFRMNQALFDLLKPFDDEAAERYRREQEALRLEQEALAWRPQTLEEFEYEKRKKAAGDYLREALATKVPRDEAFATYKKILRGET